MDTELPDKKGVLLDMYDEVCAHRLGRNLFKRAALAPRVRPPSLCAGTIFATALPCVGTSWKS
jgi:hypothetical protein